MTTRFYPALHLGDFDTAPVALARVGVTGAAAELIVATLNGRPSEPAAFQAQFAGDEHVTAAQPLLVLVRTAAGSFGLYVGYFSLLSDTRAAALLKLSAALIDDVLTGEYEVPTIDAFPWDEPAEIRQ